MHHERLVGELRAWIAGRPQHFQLSAHFMRMEVVPSDKEPEPAAHFGKYRSVRTATDIFYKPIVRLVSFERYTDENCTKAAY